MSSDEERQMPNIHTPEFRGMMFNHFLEVQEAAKNATTMMQLIDGTSYQDLTPQAWATIHMGIPSLRMILEHHTSTMEAMNLFVDDENAVEMVANKAWELHEKQRQHGTDT